MVAEFLSPAERERIAAAITAAETQTSGEIVVVIAGEARWSMRDALLAAALAALVLPLVLWLPNLVRDAAIIYLAQLGLLVALFPVLFWTPLGRWLRALGWRRTHAERRARRQFIALGLHRTRERTGLMIFLIPGEHHVQVVADEGISTKVPQQAWDGIVADLVQTIRQGRAADGIVAAVTACGVLLARHFPRSADDRNELPDRVLKV